MQQHPEIVTGVDTKDSWCQIRRVIRLAEKVRLETKDIIDSFLRELQISKANNFVANHAKIDIVCGTIKLEEEWSKWELYWYYARLAAVTQFGGSFGTFNEDGKEYAEWMIKHVLDSKAMRSFWEYKNYDLNEIVKGKNLSWLYHRTLLLDSLIQFSPKNLKTQKIMDKICHLLFRKSNGDQRSEAKQAVQERDGDCFEKTKHPICAVSKDIRKRFVDHNESRELITTDQRAILQFTRQYNVLKLAERLRKARNDLLSKESDQKICDFDENNTVSGYTSEYCERCDQGLDENFPFQEIERALTRGNDSATAFRVSLLIRLLGGRYINGSFSSNPRWILSFREGVRYVLERQSSDPDACWHDVRALRDEEDFWVHPYIPLLCILDLGPRILLPHLHQLTNACELSLSALRTRLKYFKRKDGILASFEKERDSFDIIMASLSLSMATYDRLRDLLSDSVLDSLGAETQAIFSIQKETSAEHPDEEKSKGDYKDKEEKKYLPFPTALRFGKNIQYGVVNLWENGSEERPGAILIYGPPGTGKTTIAKTLAQQLNAVRKVEHSGKDASPWRFLEITPADFAREGSDKIVACAERIFTLLKDVRRCVVLLDEMEEFIQARTPSADKNSRLITTAFLPLLQEVVKRKESILVVATNFVSNIDPAVTRRGRFSLILPLGPPDKKTRGEIIYKKLETWGKITSDNRFKDTIEKYRKVIIDNIDEIAKYTMGYTHLEIETFLHEMLAKIQKLPHSIRDKDIIRSAWCVRAEQVPTSLSNRTGCDWYTFANETKRYIRETPELEKEEYWNAYNKNYWSEPPLPKDAFSD